MSDADPRRVRGATPDDGTGSAPAGPYGETGGWPPPGPAFPPGNGPPGPAFPPPGPAYPPGYGPPGAAVPPGYGPPGWQPGDQVYGRLAGPPLPPAGPPPRRPPVRRSAVAGMPLTAGLIAANVLAYLVQLAVPGLTERYGLSPLDVEAGQYERLLTAAFLHAGVLHLATNMLALFIVGAPLERAIGSARFGVVYLASALGGSLLALALSPPNSLGVGASGAIFGLFGAAAVLHRRIGADFRGIGTLIGINLVISFAIPGISWQAHVGGLVTGAVVALLVAGRRPRARS